MEGLSEAEDMPLLETSCRHGFSISCIFRPSLLRLSFVSDDYIRVQQAA
jgi:hypothetical protein